MLRTKGHLQRGIKDSEGTALLGAPEYIIPVPLSSSRTTSDLPALGPLGTSEVQFPVLPLKMLSGGSGFKSLISLGTGGNHFWHSGSRKLCTFLIAGLHFDCNFQHPCVCFHTSSSSSCRSKLCGRGGCSPTTIFAVATSARSFLKGGNPVKTWKFSIPNRETRCEDVTHLIGHDSEGVDIELHCRFLSILQQLGSHPTTGASCGWRADADRRSCNESPKSKVKNTCTQFAVSQDVFLCDRQCMTKVKPLNSHTLEIRMDEVKTVKVPKSGEGSPHRRHQSRSERLLH
jgi:hypothetical protein